MKENATEQIAANKAAGEENAGGQNAANEALTPREIDALLMRPEVLDAIFADEGICNEVIARYLGELYAHRPAPVVRGRSALCPIPRPRTLQEAKRIVDNT